MLKFLCNHGIHTARFKFTWNRKPHIQRVSGCIKCGLG